MVRKSIITVLVISLMGCATVKNWNGSKPDEYLRYTDIEGDPEEKVRLMGIPYHCSLEKNLYNSHLYKAPSFKVCYVKKNAAQKVNDFVIRLRELPKAVVIDSVIVITVVGYVSAVGEVGWEF